MQFSLRWFSLLTLASVVALASSAHSVGRSKSKQQPLPASQQEVEQLRQLVAAQQRQLKQQQAQMDQLQSQLQQLLEAVHHSKAGLQNAQTRTVQEQHAAEEVQRVSENASASTQAASTALVNTTTANDESQRLSALEDLVGRFRFSGDVRLRGESEFQDSPAFVNRNRGRIRARFGFDSKLNEDFTAGVYLATGSKGDPTSSNETLTNFFDRKTIALDRAFITYQPVAHRWLQLTGGKFAYTWNRTSLTLDPDINPEGFSQKLSWKLNNSVAQELTVGAMQLLFSEVAAGTDSYALGGFASARLKIGRWTATPNYTALKWNNPNAILQASAFAVQATKAGNNTSGSINVPGEGPGCAGGSAGNQPLPIFPPCAIAANGMTNAVVTDASGKPVFLSGFFYNDFILNNQIATGRERLPFNILLEFQQNLDAARHPVDPNGTAIPNLGRQNMGYSFDVSLGQTRNRGDIQFGYSFWRQEQDAILAAFSESDQRAPTNILQHRIYFLYKLRSNTLASFTWWHGRTLNTALENNPALLEGTITKPGQTEPYLNRYQFDLIYTF